MQPKLLSNWGRIAGLLLIAGALAWAAKLAVIIATDGRIITTGAASLLMKVGLLLLLAGAMGVGSRISSGHNLWLRIPIILFAPVVVFGPSIFLGSFITPLFKNSSIWYAQQEAPIALAVFIYLIAGVLLHTRYKPVSVQTATY